jgi:hypothetical protein
MASTFTTNKSIEKPGYNDYATNPTGWSGPINTDFDVIDKAFGGTTVINPTSVSGTVTLSAAQYQSAILVIGVSISTAATLTANIIYSIPSGVGGTWNIFNNTTGAFTITFANAGGGTTFAIPQGEQRIIYSDGTNIRESVTVTVPAPFASGTAMLFVQTSAPTGWTKSTTHDNKALRIVSGAASSGGTTGFTSVFTARTITTSNMPAHTHGVTDPGHTHTFSSRGDDGVGGVIGYGVVGYNADIGAGAGGMASATTGITINSAGSGTAMDFAVQYVDVIICVKD